jgi:hypothetical protein
MRDARHTVIASAFGICRIARDVENSSLVTPLGQNLSLFELKNFVTGDETLQPAQKRAYLNRHKRWVTLICSCDACMSHVMLNLLRPNQNPIG